MSWREYYSQPTKSQNKHNSSPFKKPCSYPKSGETYIGIELVNSIILKKQKQSYGRKKAMQIRKHCVNMSKPLPLHFAQVFDVFLVGHPLCFTSR